MRRNKDMYYSQKPMRIYESFLSRFLNVFFKNYSREEVAAGFKLHGEKCLDIACGDGELLNRYLYKKYKRAYGVDISPRLINKAQSKKMKNCDFHVGDIDEFVEKAVKAGTKYDSIYLLAILEHIQWPSIFIREVSKIVNENGHIVIEVPNVSWLPHRLSFFLGKFPTTAPTVGAIPGVYDEHIRFFTIDTLNKIVQSAGFKLVKLDCSGKFKFIKKLYPKLLSPDIVAFYRKQ